MGLPGGHCIWHLAHLHQWSRSPERLRLVRRIADCCCVEARGGARFMVNAVPYTLLHGVPETLCMAGSA
jgi:hypothetical protein